MLRSLDKKLYIFPSLWFSLLLALAGAFDTIHAFGAEKKQMFEKFQEDYDDL